MINFLDIMGVGFANEGVEVEILDKSREPFSDNKAQNPHFVILGNESDRFISLYRKFQKDVELLQKDEDITEDELEKERESLYTTLIASMVFSWSNINDNNQTLECSIPNVEKLLNASKDTKMQVIEAIGNEGLFRKKQ